MKRLALILLASASLQAETSRGYIGEYYDGKKLQENGELDKAAAAYQRALDLSLEANNPDYATSAGLKAAYVYYRQNKRVEAGKLCREVLEALQPLPTPGPNGDAMRRAQLFGLMERGLFAEGKIGAGWKANRAAAETLRQKKVAPDGDGPPVSLRDLKEVPLALRSLVWRLIEREAEYLDIAGRSQEALKVLEAAVTLARERGDRLPKNERFYAFKTGVLYSTQLDFLGFEPEALAAAEALLAESGADIPVASRMNLKLNILRNRSQWHGPSEEILAEARTIGAALTAISVNVSGVKRLLAKMELDLKESEDAIAKLAEAISDHESKGEWFEAAYAMRDSLVALTEMDRDGLDTHFIEVLQRMRSQGNKRGEPTVYGGYGRYLRKQGRHGEAIEMYREALRLVRIFDRPLHEVPYLCSLAACYQDLGNTDGARAIFAELDALLTAHAEIPPKRRVMIEYARGRFLASTGELDPAREAFARARRIGRELPAWQLRWVTPEIEEAVLAASPPEPAATGSAAAVHLQPTGVLSVSLPDRIALSRLILTNRGSATAAGTLRAVGPGAVLTGKRGFQFHTGQAEQVVERPLSLRAGENLHIPTSAIRGGDLRKCGMRFSWLGGPETKRHESTWEVEWDPESRGNIVLDASLLSANPFRSVHFVHHLAAPAGRTEPIPFRVVSPREIRIEYYDDEDGRLLAIDCNGNGEFDEVGDLHVVGPGNLGTVWVPVSPTSEISAVEIRLYAADRELIPLDPNGITLKAQTHLGKAWRTESENILR